ncbi:hypothetical protein [Bradyrhizobium iriomotense]|uniref:Helix-turn-helix domain-containing protein n=1 Tax=Bradyrhizobium iriomotense TaxID=441950 RepID=A0ABQ6B5N6_9BRAD|nr:hypothetical protein [Bradyrhizobium iriomotense]GLR89722.1 hypothetical protein GCM10007857_64360 [Bradyrhizobium iriomotense]
MGAAVAISRFDLTAPELRKAAQREKDSTAARRMLALALVLEGEERRKAAKNCGMDRQTLRDWGIGTTWKAWPGFRHASRLVLSPKLAVPRETRACRSRHRFGAAWGGALAAD